MSQPQIWTAIALTIVTWALSYVFFENISMVVWTRNAAQIGSFLGGAIAGFCLGQISRLNVAELRTKHVLFIAAGWAVAWLVRLELGFSMAELLGDSGLISSWTLSATVKCLLGGFITALVLRRARPTLPARAMYVIPIGWAMGFALQMLIATTADQRPYERTTQYLLIIALNAAIEGAIGGGVMFWAISSGRSEQVRNETVSAMHPVISSAIGTMIGATGGGLIGQALLGPENGFILGLMLGAIVGAFIGGTMFRRTG
jgi:uncharacterized protein YcfJ